MRLGSMAVAAGLLSQIGGTPHTSGHRSLVDFEKTELRAILGIEL